MDQPSSAPAPARARLLVLLVACALLGAACGARWDADQAASVAARYEAGGRSVATGGGSAVTDVVGGDATDAGDAGGPVTEVTADGTGPAAGEPVTGPEAAGGESPAPGGGEGGGGGPLACAAPADAPGVTDDQIALGAVNSLSGPVPGLGTSFDAATKAYAAYRNATGGVCGRQLVVKGTDDAGDNARNRSVVDQLSGEVLAIIPGAAGGGDGGAEIVQSKSVPAVGISVYERLAESPTFYGVVPLVQGDTVTAKYRYLVEQGVTKAAVVYIEQSAAEAAYQRRLIQAAGIEVVLNRSFSVATFSFDSIARAVANSGADYLIFMHEAGNSASMAKSMAGTGHELTFEEYIIAYGSDFISLAGSAAEGVTTWLYSLPAEDGGTVPEHAAFLQWMQRTAPNANVDTFAAAGWASAKAIADSLEALPGPISRQALLDQLAATTTYDAGGFLAPIELGAKRSRGCLVAMIVDGGQWKRLTPSEGFLC